MEEWALIRWFHLAEAMRPIAERLGISRNTVAKAVRSEVPPKYERVPVGSAIKAEEPKILAPVKENPWMPTMAIAEWIHWSDSPVWLSENVARMRSGYVPADPADRISYGPGIRFSVIWSFPRCRFPAVQAPRWFSL